MPVASGGLRMDFTGCSRKRVPRRRWSRTGSPSRTNRTFPAAGWAVLAARSRDEAKPALRARCNALKYNRFLSRQPRWSGSLARHADGLFLHTFAPVDPNIYRNQMTGKLGGPWGRGHAALLGRYTGRDRKSTRLNSSHG